MKIKFVVMSALVGATVSFAFNPALAASTGEPTSLAAFLRQGRQEQAVRPAKPAGNAAAPGRTSRKSVRPVGAGGALSPLIDRYAAAYGVSSALARAVVRHASNFQPHMRGRAGEIGLMQIKLSTARAMGYSGSTQGLYEPATNIRYGMKYLAMAQKLGGGGICGTILRYNAGHGATRMNPVSAQYCRAVKVYMRAF